MNRSIVFVLLALGVLGIHSEAFAGGSCTVCFDNVTDEDISHHKAYACSNHHCIDRDCLTSQVEAVEDVKELESKGLSCCGEKCKERVSLATIREILEPKKRQALDARLAKASGMIDRSEAEVQRLAEGIEGAFNLCCPTEGCGSTLD